MRTFLSLGSLAAVLLVGTGCRSHVAGRCDCTNHPESAVIPAPSANYPIVGGSSVSNATPYATPNSIAPSGVMGSSTAPMAMPSTTMPK